MRGPAGQECVTVSALKAGDRFDHAAAEHDLPALLGLPRLRARVAVCDLYGIG